MHPMKTLATLLLAAVLQLPLQAQFQPDEAYKQESINTIVEMINDVYVFKDVAKATTDFLLSELKNGRFDECKKMTDFAEELTKTVRYINKDRHMAINAMTPRKTEAQSPARYLEDILDAAERQRAYSAGFSEVAKLDGNIGYLDIRSFEHREAGAPVADAYMALLTGSDAIIIDLRKNGGGDPAMVQYLCSYFFDEEVHLNSLYWRDRDRTDEFWTIPVNGTKLPEVPLFILTSDYTFSGAEEFSYNMQTQKRAKIIGEVTGGGANPGRRFPVNDYLSINIPMGTAINPVTNTNWEGIGVKPDVLINADEALEKSMKMATRAAEAFKAKREAAQKATTDKIVSTMDKIDEHTSKSLLEIYEQVIFKNLENALEEGWIKEAIINMLGYTSLGNLQPEAAEVIFKCNTLLFPNSANTYDSYAEALMANGKTDKSLENYELAVKLATEQNSPMLKMLKENLEKAKQGDP